MTLCSIPPDSVQFSENYTAQFVSKSMIWC